MIYIKIDKLKKWALRTVILSISIITMIFLGPTIYMINEARAIKFKVVCSQFKDHTAAQKYYDTKQRGYYKLYANKNGIVCKDLLKGIIK